MIRSALVGLGFVACSAAYAETAPDSITLYHVLSTESRVGSCMNQHGNVVEEEQVVTHLDGDSASLPPTSYPDLSTAALVSPSESYIDTLRLIHHHPAVDYQSGSGLAVRRIHRYRDQYQISSYGPGVFSNYDVYLWGSVNSDPTKSDNLNLFHPFDRVVTRMKIQGSNTDVYTDHRTDAIEGLRLYAEGVDEPRTTIVSKLIDAKSAEITSYTGRVYLFEMIDLSTSDDWKNIHGRLISVSDEQGTEAFTISYQYDESNLPSDRASVGLFMINTVNDGSSELTFTYGAEIMGNAYPVTRITSGRNVIAYRYRDDGRRNDLTRKESGDKILVNNTSHDAAQNPLKTVDTSTPFYGLVKVRRNIRDEELRDRSSITYRIDWENKTQVFSYDDKGAETQQSTISLSLQTWWPDGTKKRAIRWVREAIDQITEDSTPFYSQVPGLVRMVQDANDVITHVNWIGADPFTGKDQATYFYTSEDPLNGEPAIMASVSRGGYPVADRWAKPGQITTNADGSISIPPLDAIDWDGFGFTYGHNTQRQVISVNPYPVPSAEQ